MSRDDILPLIAAWDGEGVVVRYDKPTDTWIFIAFHSSRLGRPTGGTRLRVYPDLRAALRDAMRLAEGMTSKWAGLGVRYGGGKAVLAIRRPLDAADRRGLMLRYGELLETLGAFYTGADLGTGPDDMVHMARRTRCILGVDSAGHATDPGPYTARGVAAGLRSALRHRFGDASPAGRRILIQGLGGVGAPLARRLAAEGAELLLCDLESAKAEALAVETDGRIVPVDRVYTEPCDVFAPCAIGGILDRRTIAMLACQIVVGSANNQLDGEDDADRLRKWGILYVPDYIVNAGGALTFSLMADGVRDEDELAGRVDAIGSAVADILAEADVAGTTPLVAARRRVDRLLARSADED
ncbi:MAG: Glu/Leu/Phe/Val dehydrogenase dimerization domain-containing protein [Acidobacteriota bacterium]